MADYQKAAMDLAMDSARRLTIESDRLTALQRRVELIAAMVSGHSVQLEFLMGRALPAPPPPKPPVEREGNVIKFPG